ncbi:precorrin-6Y C5,15-methyltransferase (decarboxylating) [Nocardioides luteus]|uniref:Precorrin-6Y methyltransferase n=1 Tax=Nocardioides luteus TaxID=1844 RepID=A0ABQ5T1Z7_9ACTN|nr:precorrin-6y C5,15-methyltransferase (decarboxylating) subunit CbiE [Nocardioides luteus]MDR7311634.1 precorrin-6Y C5,15-methyltransferase (decarboxylating) [Nocardioides luteus]GGR54300.1 precorrin-6Y methyltransferase [Nocardioides luteus]GLJ70284.1 precorrin-6Y methyltransferase [Nocardioides luteus]
MIVVVGIGAGGWDEIPVRHQQLIREASVLLGGKRHLALVPDVPGQRREPWPSPLREGLPDLLEGLGDAVALASGDPLVSGIGTTLIDLLGRENVRIEPAVSSVSLARARMGWAAESCTVVSVVGRDVALVARELAPGRRILALSSDGSTPAEIAELLVRTGFGASVMTVLGDLGATSESRRTAVAEAWAAESPKLNIVAIECVRDRVGFDTDPLVPRGSGSTSGGEGSTPVEPPEPLGGGVSRPTQSFPTSWTPGLPDDAFEHDGQLTKRDLRASALARLAPTPGEHLWDVGAGAGSVGIEWMRAHPTCTATAVESHPERASRIARNAARLGTPGLRIVEGRAPDALADLRPPDAIFIGGGATRPGVLDACLAALRPGGRIVVHGVTLETEQLLARQHAERGGELTRISVESVDSIGTFRGWAPQRAVVQWAR